MRQERVAYQLWPGAHWPIPSRRRLATAAASLALIGLGVTGCGLFRFEQREPWRLQAEQACLRTGEVRAGVHITQAPAVNGPGACGMDYPFKVAAFGEGSVSLKTRATLACPMIPRTDSWLAEVVQPAAQTAFGQPVVEMRAGSYSCRPRNNRSGAKLSEHSFGNALDIMAFRLADGREVTVVKGWKGAPDEQDFLREVFVGACRYYTTVLGPGADMFHYDHFHLDLARHDPRGQRSICKPVIKFTPRDAGRGGYGEPWSGAPVRKGAPSDAPASHDTAPDEEIDPETDPFAIEDSADAARATRPRATGNSNAVAAREPANRPATLAPVPTVTPVPLGEPSRNRAEILSASPSAEGPAHRVAAKGDRLDRAATPPPPPSVSRPESPIYSRAAPALRSAPMAPPQPERPHHEPPMAWVPGPAPAPRATRLDTEPVGLVPPMRLQSRQPIPDSDFDDPDDSPVRAPAPPVRRTGSLAPPGLIPPGSIPAR